MIGQFPSDRPAGDYVKQSKYHEEGASRQSRRSRAPRYSQASDLGRFAASGHIQLWNHIRWNQEEYGIIWATSTGYRYAKLASVTSM